MQAPRDTYLDSLTRRIAALRMAEEALASDPASARESIALISRSLRDSGAANGFPEVTQAATALEESDAQTFAPRLANLIGILAHAGGGNEPSTHSVPERSVVLIVEDDPISAAFVEAGLAADDREILLAVTGAQAMALVTTRKIALVILDLVLPDMDGRAFLMKLQENPRTVKTPVLVISGKIGELTRRECISLGATAFLAKPVELEGMRAAVTRALAGDGPDWSPGSKGESGIVPAIGSARKVVETGIPLRETAGQGHVTRNILVAEDDELIAKVIVHRLNREGFNVHWACDGVKAMEAMEGGDFSLAILDVKMPMMDGFEVLGRIRRAPGSGKLPVLMLTSLGKEKDVSRGFELGADDYLTKPFSPVELLARVKNLVRKS